MENCDRFVFYNNIFFFLRKTKNKEAALRDMMRH